jgi:hypothetical protein
MFKVTHWVLYVSYAFIIGVVYAGIAFQFIAIWQILAMTGLWFIGMILCCIYDLKQLK